MSSRSLLRLLAAVPLTALLLSTAACGDDDSGSADPGPDAGSGGSGEVALVPEGATPVWSVTLEEDWSPTHAAAVGDLVVVSTSWEIDEGSEVTAYASDGSVAWTFEQLYGSALLAPLESGDLLVCDSEDAITMSVDGSVLDESPVDGEERCPVADDEEGIPVPRNDEAYTVSGDQLEVDGPDGSYTIPLEDTDPEIWGVDGGVVTFNDDTDEVRLYR